jgi:Flp pilus assembly pilin Flp
VVIPSGSGALADERGVVSVEYTVLLVLVALVCAFAVAALGIPLVRMFETQTTWLFLRLP